MNYDSWKQQTPDENDLEKECAYCGNPTNEYYCSKECKKLDIN